MMRETNPYLRATILEAVENQLRMNDPPETQQTLQRLMAQGHSEKEVKRLIGCVLVCEIYDVMKNHQPFNHAHYVKALAGLPVLPWDDEDGPYWEPKK